VLPVDSGLILIAISMPLAFQNKAGLNPKVFVKVCLDSGVVNKSAKN